MSVRPTTLPIVVDSPTAKPGLGFDRYVDGIAAAVLGGHPARYTVGLYGPWGSGKSSLLAGIEASIKEKSVAPAGKGKLSENGPIIVRFDAWRYEKSDSLIFPLLHSIKRTIEAERGRLGGAADSLIASLKSLVGNMELSFLGVGLKYEKSSAPDNESYSSPFEGLEGFSKSLGAKRRVVILVDDLDRCSPEGVVNVLEAIHVLTDVDGFVFVLALDYEYLISAITQRYPHSDAHHFIEKIVQVPFHIPRAKVEQDVLVDIIENWNSTLRTSWFVGVAEAVIEEIIYIALRSNPRQVKRLFNTFLLARYMEWEQEEKAELLLRVLALQIGWPNDFRRLHSAITEYVRNHDDTPAAFLRDVTMYEILSRPAEVPDEAATASVGSNPPSLVEYLTKILPGDVLLSDIEPIMNLTEAVTVTVTGPADSGEERQAGESPLELSLQRASTDLRALHDEVLGYCLDQGADASARPAANYTAIRCEPVKGGPLRVFASLNVKPLKDRLLVFLTIPIDGREEADFVRDVSKLGHHGIGGFEISLYPGHDTNVERAKRFIDESYAAMRR